MLFFFFLTSLRGFSLPALLLYLFFGINFIYLFMPVLGLRYHVQAFSSCGERGPLLIAVHGPPTAGASRCGARAPGAQASVVVALGL